MAFQPMPLLRRPLIVCLDKRGRPQFRDLLFHRGEPCFFAFDLLMADGKDLRSERLTDRKGPESRMRYVDHVEQHGRALFQRVKVVYWTFLLSWNYSLHSPLLGPLLEVEWTGSLFEGYRDARSALKTGIRSMNVNAISCG
jgi:hypothetical protein